jgi:hypothetical protein
MSFGEKFEDLKIWNVRSMLYLADDREYVTKIKAGELRMSYERLSCSIGSFASKLRSSNSPPVTRHPLHATSHP